MNPDENSFLIISKEQLSEKKKKVLEEQRHVTEKVSDLCRYIGFGISALTYAIFSSEANFTTQLVVEYTTPLLLSTFLAVLTIFLDYLQFLCGYISVREALGNKNDEYRYKLKSPFYKGRFLFFTANRLR